MKYNRMIYRFASLAMKSYPFAYAIFRLYGEIFMRYFSLNLSNNTKPILVGPWTTEIGHELLYWIPFLENLKEQCLLPRENTLIISRGGNSLWYKRISDNYYNFFDGITVENYVTALKKRSVKSSRRYYVDDFDLRIINNAKKHFNLNNDYILLHPLYMNRWFAPVWKGKINLRMIEKLLIYRHFEDDNFILPSELRENQCEFVTMKFWFNEGFPHTFENLKFINRLINKLCKKYKILLLHPYQPFDDHMYAKIQNAINLINCSDMIQPNNNLLIQTALMRKAKYFVGTLGGFSFIAPYLKKPSFSFFSAIDNRPNKYLCQKLHLQLSPTGGYHETNIRNFDIDELP